MFEQKSSVILILLLSLGTCLYAQPAIEVEPREIDFNILFENFFVGGPYQVNIRVTNAGTDELVVDSITVDNEMFSVEPVQFVEAPRESREVTVTFEANENVGEQNGRLIIFSNDPDEEEFEILLHATPLMPPVIEVDPLAIGDEAGDFVVNIANTGGSPLRFIIEEEIISEPQGGGRDDGGDVLARLDLNAANSYCSPIGWDPHDGIMFISYYDDNLIRAITTEGLYENPREIRRWNVQRPMDGGMFAGVLFICNLETPATLLRFDRNGNRMQDLNMGYPVYGVAFDRKNNRMFAREQAGDYPIHVYEMDGLNRGEEIGQIVGWQQFNGNNVNVYNVEWVDKHRDGQLWMVNNVTGRIYQIAVDTDNWRAVGLVQSFPAQITQPFDTIAHDGHNMWVGGYDNADIRIYDDGITELYWLSYDPRSGEIEADGDMDIIVTLNEAGLIDGDYEADLHIFSNDPANPDVVVSIVMHVIQPFWFAFEWNEQFGYPDLIDFTRGIINLYPDHRYVVPVRVWNGGGDDFIIEDIFCDNEHFSFEPASFVLRPNERRTFEVRFSATEPGQYEGVISIITNDLEWQIPVWAVVRRAPLLPHEWDGASTHSLVLMDIRFEGWTVSQGWEVGIFTPHGVWAGWMQVDASGPPWGMTAFGNDNNQENLFNPGEIMTFRLWDPLSNREYRAIPDYTEGPRVWTADGLSILSLNSWGQLHPPVIVVEPMVLELEMTNDEIAEEVLYVENMSDTLIRFSIESEYLTDVPDQDWLSYEPSESELNVGEYTHIIVILNAKELTDGDFEANMYFHTDDQGDVPITVHILIHVADLSIRKPVVHPLDFALKAPYPNPFNSATTVGFDIPLTSDARLAVFDLSGRKLATLMEGSLSTGQYNVVWEATGFSGGTYIIRLEAGGKMFMSKALLIK